MYHKLLVTNNCYCFYCLFHVSTKRISQVQILCTWHSSDITSKIRMVAMFVIVDLQIMFHIKTQGFHDGYNVSINKCLPMLPNLRKTLVKCKHLFYSFEWWRNEETLENRSEVPGNVWNVVLEKDGKDHLDWSCNKWRSATKSRGEEYPANKKKKEVRLTGLG